MKEMQSIIYLLARRKAELETRKRKHKMLHPNYHEDNGEIRGINYAINLIKQAKYGRTTG